MTLGCIKFLILFVFSKSCACLFFWLCSQMFGHMLSGFLLSYALFWSIHSNVVKNTWQTISREECDQSLASDVSACKIKVQLVRMLLSLHRRMATRWNLSGRFHDSPWFLYTADWSQCVRLPLHMAQCVASIPDILGTVALNLLLKLSLKFWETVLRLLRMPNVLTREWLERPPGVLGPSKFVNCCLTAHVQYNFWNITVQISKF